MTKLYFDKKAGGADGKKVFLCLDSDNSTAPSAVGKNLSIEFPEGSEDLVREIAKMLRENAISISFVG